MSANLKMQNQKMELIRWLATVEDSTVIDKIIALKKQENQQSYDFVSEPEQNSLEKGIHDAEDGKLNPHSNARKLYDKWL